jgi:pyridoxine/pyridoxamine 5'-phosphate oxidase
MTLAEIIAFMQQHRLAVQASVSKEGGPQAAVVGIAVSAAGEIVFDTLSSTRKCQNLRQERRIALVIGWDQERTVQYEGVADEPMGSELERCKELYFSVFPDGRERERWPGISYFRVQPRWLRYSDFSGADPKLVELQLPVVEH